MNAPAKTIASSSRSGPRSIVINGLPWIEPRQAWSNGSPSTREVITSIAGQSATVAVIVANWVSVTGSAQWTSSTITRIGMRPLTARTRSATTSRLPSLRVALSMASYIIRSSADCGRSKRSSRNTRWSAVSRPSAMAASAAARRAALPPPGGIPIKPRTMARIASWPLPTPKSRTSPLWSVKPWSAARAINSSTRRVLPMPASPRTTIDPPRPVSWHASMAAVNCRSSARRPTKALLSA